MPMSAGAYVVAIASVALASCDSADPRVGESGTSVAESLAVSANDLLADCSVANPSGCLTMRKPGKMAPGYTYIDNAIDQSRGLPNKAYLIDSHGNLVHTWDVGFGGKLLPNGHVLAGLPFPDAEGQFVVNLDCLVELDWNNNVVWPPDAATVIGGNGARFCDPRGQIVGLNTDELGRPVAWQHHDVQREGNPVGYYAPSQRPKIGGGKTLILALDLPRFEDTSYISDFPLFSDKIVEVEVDAEGTNVLFEWRAHEHFEARGGDLGYGFDAVAKRAIETVRAGLANPEIANRTDWLHINNAAYLGPNRWCRSPKHPHCDLRFHPENIIFNSREANFIAIIARHAHPRGVWSSGDIVWRVGPSFAYGSGKIDQLIGPHHAHLIPFPLHGAGNILVFDNGGTAPFGGGWGADADGNPSHPNKFRPYSRVVEFDPITLDVVWIYERPDPDTVPLGENFAPFRSDLASSAQRLVNGNTLITEALSGRLFEVTMEGELVWEFVSPFGPMPPYGDPSMGTAKPGNLVYRAYRIPNAWVAGLVDR
ncbi:MAG TPA: hypothetical protein VI072_32070 [Polyangiaceae bacterium]